MTALPNQPVRLHSLRPSERLRGKITLEELFKKGSSFFVYPFKVKWLLTDEPQAAGKAAVVWVIPKRNTKKATLRNTLRRRCKEAYRLNKHHLPDMPASKGFHIALVCVAKDEVPFASIQRSTVKILKEINKHSSKTLSE